MFEYIIESYGRLYWIFMFGWVVYVAAVIICLIWLVKLEPNDKHRGQKRYYGIIAIVVFLVIGVLGSIFLPSPELVRLWVA